MLSLSALLIALLFIASLINGATLIVCTVVICLILCIKEREIGAIKSLIIITVRSILNPGLTQGYDSYSLIKWALIFLLCIYAIIATPREKIQKLTFFENQLLLYSLLLMLLSWLGGSYPIVSIFKIISWAFVFGSVMYVVQHHTEYDWQKFMAILLNAVVVVSVVFIRSRVGYLINGRGFQGVTNHPNVFGIICALTFSLDITAKWMKKRPKILLCALCVVLCYFSRSRTGMLSIVILFVYWIYRSEITSGRKVVIVLGALVLLLVAVAFGDFADIVTSFLLKGGRSGTMFDSRAEQANDFIDRFLEKPLIGTGFMTPYYSWLRSYEFTFDLIVEPGTIVTALLGYTGIFGTLGFVLLYGFLFRNTRGDKRVLFLMPFVLSMGEMAFFSTNNIAILYYVVFAHCVEFCP